MANMEKKIHRSVDVLNVIRELSFFSVQDYDDIKMVRLTLNQKALDKLIDLRDSLKRIGAHSLEITIPEEDLLISYLDKNNNDIDYLDKGIVITEYGEIRVLSYSDNLPIQIEITEGISIKSLEDDMKILNASHKNTKKKKTLKISHPPLPKGRGFD